MKQQMRGGLNADIMPFRVERGFVINNIGIQILTADKDKNQFDIYYSPAMIQSISKKGDRMNDDRQKEILTFFAGGDKYRGPKLQDMDFTQEELHELRDLDYINCLQHTPLRYCITIKGLRHLNLLKI